MYRDITARERLVWLNSFSNEGCGITRATFEQAFPLEIQNEIDFTEQDGKTIVMLRARPHGATGNERKVFEGMFPSLEQGCGGTFERIANHLVNV